MDTNKRSRFAWWLLVGGALAACGPSPTPEIEVETDDSEDPPERHTYCFVAGTPVLVPGGQVSIDALEVGDSVVAWSESRGEPVVRAVTQLLERRVPRTLVLDLGDREIETTEEHPFYSLSEDRWVEAGDLVPGTLLARLDGDDLVPIVLRQVSPGRPATVFNLTVEGPEHDFFADEVLVHNKQPVWEDTALRLQYYSGFGTVDGGAYAGAESVIVVAGPTGDVLCEFTWAAAGSSPSAQVTPCTDADGNACEFTLDVTLDGGVVTSGCDEQGAAGVGPYDYTYGFINDYGYGGNGYGPAFMFYFDGYGWYGISPYASFDGTTFEYEAFFYQYAYVP